MRKFSEITLYIACGIVFSILLGFIVYQKLIFLPGSMFFHFVSFGIIGAITLALVRFSKVWIAALFVLAVAIVTFIVSRIAGHQFSSVLYVTFWFLVLGYAILGMGCLFRTGIKRLPIGKFLIFGVILCLLFIAQTFVRYIPFTKLVPLTEIIANAKIGFFLGCGLGLGAEIGEMLGKLMRRGDQDSQPAA